MKIPLLLACVVLLSGCYHTTSVHITRSDGTPVADFPLLFELDQGLVHDPKSSPGLEEVGAQTYEAKTDSDGVARITYRFLERQPPAWKVRLLGAQFLPDQHVGVVPLSPLPEGSRIKVATPNP